MPSTQVVTAWQQAEVDPAKEHFELRFGSANDDDWASWTVVAIVGPPVAGVVPVEFLIDPVGKLNAEMIAAVSKEVQFYLVELKNDDPWGYAQYHCWTASNLYSNVHWGYRASGIAKG